MTAQQTAHVLLPAVPAADGSSCTCRITTRESGAQRRAVNGA